MRGLGLMLLVAAAAMGCAEEATPETRLDRAVLLLDRGQPVGALDAIDAAIADDPNVAELHGQRGLILERLDRPDDALQAYSRALEIDPDNAAALTDRAALHGRRGDREAALADLDAAIAIDPTQHVALANRSLALLETGQAEQAIEDLKAVEGLAPGQAETARRLGVALDALGRTEEAGDWLREAVRRDDGSAAATRDLARHERAAGQPDAAIAGFDRAISLAPSMAAELLAERDDTASEAAVVAALADAGHSPIAPAAAERRPFVLDAGGRPVMVVPVVGGRATLSTADVAALRADPSALVVVVGEGPRGVTIREASAIDLDALRPAAFTLPLD